MTAVQHELDQETLNYGSETGNWYGRCRFCGKKIILYTGSSEDRPGLVPKFGVARVNRADPDVDFEVVCYDAHAFICGKPDAIMRYGICFRQGLE